MHSQVNYLKTEITKDSLFGISQQTGLDYVLKLDPDKLLSPCYSAMGKTPKNSTYGGWESMQIQGHSLGHYISALAGFYDSTGSKEAKEKLDYTIRCIKEIQRQDGYFAGIPSTPFDRAFNGEINAERFSLNQWWVPWYSIHKIYAGLIDAYVFGKNDDALSIVKKMADWAIRGTERLDDVQFQKMLLSEHGGMLKVYADLYGITGEEKYLKMAERFVHQEIVKPLIKERDKLQGYHANTQIPKIIGLARLYEVSGNKDYRTACEFFFRTVTEHRSYAIGGNSVGEHFAPLDSERLDKNTTETCNTYNMIELAEHIFAWNKNSAAADYYEKALYNHILASQDPKTGAKTYYVSLLPGFYKVYGSLENSFWCCTGTGMENPERYNRFIAKQIKDTVYINLFIDSTVETENGGKIKITTKFPFEQKCSIKILKAPSKSTKLKVRSPVWCKNEKAESDGYIALSSSIKTEEEFNIDLPMSINVRRTKDRSGNFSIQYGPIVLAADLGAKGITGDVANNDQNMYANMPAAKVSPVTADPTEAESWVETVDLKNLIFKIPSSATQDKVEYTLMPFFNVHHTRYTVYFNAENPKEDERKTKYEKITADFIEPGRQQSEVDHRYKNEGSIQGYIPEVDRSFRQAEKGGKFSYKMRFNGTGKNKMIVTCYGKDSGAVKILVDGLEIGKAEFNGSKGKELVDLELEVPEKFIKEKAKGKKNVTLTVILESSGEKNLRVLELRTVK